VEELGVGVDGRQEGRGGTKRQRHGSAFGIRDEPTNKSARLQRCFALGERGRGKWGEDFEQDEFDFNSSMQTGCGEWEERLGAGWALYL
jgi:hypothetical protein